MTLPTRIPLLLVLLAPWFAAADSPPEGPVMGASTVEVHYVSTAFGGGNEWTVFSDGRIQHVSLPGGPEGGAGYLRSGRLSVDDHAALRKRVEASGLVGASFTQRPKHPICAEGVTRLTLDHGKTVLSPEPVEEPTAETRRLSKAMSALVEELWALCEPHLSEAYPAGTYVQATVASAEDTERALARMPQAPPTQTPPASVYPALAQPGLWVRVDEAEAPTQGQPVLIQGRIVVWRVARLGDAPPR